MSGAVILNPKRRKGWDGGHFVYRPYGKVREFFHATDPEQMLSGPAETGKTLGSLNKLVLLCSIFPGLRALLLRKTYNSLVDSAIVTLEEKVLRDALGKTVKKYGGDRPKYYDFPNKARIVCSGMDGSQDSQKGKESKSKVLSAEYDVIVVNQAEELTQQEWELLTSRATGRAGNAPYGCVIGDCNPGPPSHWILKREAEGKMRVFHTTHRDNPTLFHPETGKITRQGQATMRVLDALTGTRRLRLRDGLWVASEGAVYPEFQETIHVIDRFEIPRAWRRIRSVDFGFVHPFVCSWYAIDEDERMFLYRQIYMTRRIVSDHAMTIRERSVYADGTPEHIEATVCDHDAEDRATLEACGIRTIPAFKNVSHGINAVKERYRVQQDQRARLYYLRDSLVELDEELKRASKPTSTVEEIPYYVWRDHATRDEPVKVDDDGVDADRYAVAYVDRLASKFGRRARKHGTQVYR